MRVQGIGLGGCVSVLGFRDDKSPGLGGCESFKYP